MPCARLAVLERIFLAEWAKAKRKLSEDAGAMKGRKRDYVEKEVVRRQHHVPGVIVDCFGDNATAIGWINGSVAARAPSYAARVRLPIHPAQHVEARHHSAVRNWCAVVQTHSPGGERAC